MNRRHAIAGGLAALFCAGTIGSGVYQDAKTQRLGRAPDEPQQRYKWGEDIKEGDFTIRPVADFNLTAVLLARKDYHDDAAAPIAPTDLVLGWGPMSRPDVFGTIKFDQSNRWYTPRHEARSKLPAILMRIHTANMHFVPATDDARIALALVERGQTLKVKGQLVDIIGPDKFSFFTSTSRWDNGGGACEIVYADSIEAV